MPPPSSFENGFFFFFLCSLASAHPASLSSLWNSLENVAGVEDNCSSCLLAPVPHPSSSSGCLHRHDSAVPEPDRYIARMAEAAPVCLLITAMCKSHPNLVSLAAPPTNYGLLEQLKQKWLAPKTGLRESIYTTSYPRLPVCALSRREHAIPVPPARLHPIPRF